MAKYEALYRKSPLWLQNLGLQAYGIYWRNRRFGRRFAAIVKELESREKWDLTRWQEWQLSSLQSIVARAHQGAPHYQRAFAQHGLRNPEIKTLEDLRNLPILDKQDLRRNPSDFLTVRQLPKGTRIYHTSGSTGTPLAIYTDPTLHAYWEACCEAYLRRWAGIKSTDRRIMIGGRLIVPPNQTKPPYWRKVITDNVLYVSAFHIRPDTVHDIAGAFHEFGARWITGYASANAFLAQLAFESNVAMPHIDAAITSSETLFPEMRESIEKCYSTRVHDQYGMVEACGMINQCEHSSYHVIPAVGICEIVDDDGQPVAEGSSGSMVWTGLVNSVQPLIRYKIGDICVRARTGFVCPCGRPFPVVERLEGRVEDTIFGTKGQRIVRFHGIFVDIAGVLRGQVVQENFESITVNIETAGGFGQKEELMVHQRIRDRLGEVRVTVKLMDQIPTDKSGKFRPVISRIKTAHPA